MSICPKNKSSKARKDIECTANRTLEGVKTLCFTPFFIDFYTDIQ